LRKQKGRKNKNRDLDATKTAYQRSEKKQALGRRWQQRATDRTKKARGPMFERKKVVEGKNGTPGGGKPDPPRGRKHGKKKKYAGAMKETRRHGTCPP